MTRKEYYADHGMTQDAARIAGPVIDGMREKRGHIDATDLVAAAQDRSSPLHRFFEWDNVKAAHRHRLEQARLMMRSIRVRVVETSSGKVLEEGPLLFSVPLKVVEPETKPSRGTQGNRHVYVSVQRVREEPDLRKSVLDEAWKEMLSWRRRYLARQEALEAFREEFQPILEGMAEIEVRRQMTPAAREEVTA